ncbi:MAG: hypothetical protein R3C26_11825 [Calditrichia bacterium]
MRASGEMSPGALGKTKEQLCPQVNASGSLPKITQTMQPGSQ